jgi:hypothetical protein
METGSKELVSQEVARKELFDWFERLDIEVNEEDPGEASSVRTLIKAISTGNLVVNDDLTLLQKLKTPIGEGGAIREFKFKNRLSAGELQKASVGVKAGDMEGRFIGLIGVLSANTRAVVSNLDSRDYKIAQSIALFFM